MKKCTICVYFAFNHHAVKDHIPYTNFTKLWKKKKMVTGFSWRRTINGRSLSSWLILGQIALMITPEEAFIYLFSYAT